MALTKTPIELSSTQGIVDNSNATAITIDSSENVGIGTGSPRTLINASSSTGAILTLESSDTTLTANGVIGGIDFYSNDSSTNGAGAKVNIRAIGQNSSGTATALTFGTSASGSATAVEAMRIDASGNVGINSASPAATLHTVANAGTTGFLLTGAASNNIASFYTSGGSQAMTLDSAGNVGIGFTSPQAKLQVLDQLKVSTTDQSQGVVALGDGSSTQFGVGIARWNGSSNSGGAGGLGYFSQGTVNSGGHFFYAGDAAAGSTTERARIDASGNLLVGKTSSSVSSSGLTVIANDFMSYTNTSTDSGDRCLVLNRQNGSGNILDFKQANGLVGGIGTNGGDLTIGTGDTGLTFEDAANVIHPINQGTGAARDAAIDLGKSAARFKDLYLSGSAKSQGVELEDIKAKDTSGINLQTSNGQKRVILDNAGHLLVGTTINGTPPQGIGIIGGIPNSLIRIGHANGTVSGNLYMQFAYNQSQLGSISQHGTSQVLFNTTSDERAKENIVDAPTASDDIDAIQVRSFNWKADGVHQKYGMIAQELQTVAPEAVSGDADSEEMMGVDYSKLVPMLIKEIQSLRNRVAQLEA